MVTYFKMKHQEWKIKKQLYGAILGFLHNQEEIWEIIQKMYIALKNTSADEFQKEFIDRLAEIIHEDR